MNHDNYPTPTKRTPQRSPHGPLRSLYHNHRASQWAVVVPVVLAMLLSTFAAHAQERPGARQAVGGSCEVCIPEDFAAACDKAAQDADVYWGEAAAMRKHARELEEMNRRQAVEAELARREAEAASARGWWLFAGGSAATTVVLVLVYALAN